MSANVTRETIETIIREVSNGKSLKSVLEQDGMPPAYVFYEWLDKDVALATAYARAKTARAQLLADEIVDIADNEQDAQKARNRIQARQWYASKIVPREFGDRIDVNVTQTVDVSIALKEARARVLRPVRDQLEAEDAQVIDLVPLVLPKPADKESVTVEKAGPEKEQPDIFS